MSGNVSQMVNLLEMCLTTMDGDIPLEGVLHSTIGAVNAVHKVYVGMQVHCTCMYGLNFNNGITTCKLIVI